MAIENAQLFEKIEKLSNTDEMTGVYNYRFLREKIESLIQQKISPIALVMIDMDNFKACNDSYGHLYGDEILKVFSSCLVKNVAEKGYAIRYGGDEFILLMPKMNRKQTMRMINNIKQSKNNICRQRAACRFSYGIAVYPRNGLSLGALIDYADKLLYQQKSEKRNEYQE
jgi:diguanylate cyclase (GGDEF)-like protein